MEECKYTTNLSEVGIKCKDSVFSANFLLKCLFLDYILSIIDKL